MRRLAILAGFLLQALFAWQPAFAGACPLAGGAKGTCACTVGTGSTTCLNANTNSPYRLIVVDNESPTATIACTDDGTTPAINTAGSYTITPGMTRTWSAANVTFGGPLACVASAGSTPVTVKGQ